MSVAKTRRRCACGKTIVSPREQDCWECGEKRIVAAVRARYAAENAARERQPSLKGTGYNTRALRKSAVTEDYR